MAGTISHLSRVNCASHRIPRLKRGRPSFEQIRAAKRSTFTGEREIPVSGAPITDIRRKKMNTDITASTKPEFTVVDRNPPFTKVVGNFSSLDYLRFVTITGVSVTVGYLSGIKPGIKGPSMVTGGLIGVMGGFMYAYQNSAGRLMGFFPNDDEVVKYKKKLNQ